MASVTNELNVRVGVDMHPFDSHGIRAPTSRVCAYAHQKINMDNRATSQSSEHASMHACRSHPLSLAGRHFFSQS